jgi:hypothetical protein
MAVKSFEPKFMKWGVFTAAVSRIAYMDCSSGASGDMLRKVITDGAPGTAMLPFQSQLTPEEIQGLGRYVRSFDKTPIKDVKASGDAKKAKPAVKSRKPGD